MYNTSLFFTCPSCGLENLGASLSLPTYSPSRNISVECSNPSCGGYWDLKWEITNYVFPDPSTLDPSAG